MWGCNTNEIKLKYGTQYAGYFTDNISKWLKNGCIEKTATVYTLTQKGKLQADGIASDLFIID
jgi:coproporphyrinogen III oxidase-like Fe-S oxidoreductase